MLKEIHYVHLENNNVVIAYQDKYLNLREDGGDLSELDEFLQFLCNNKLDLDKLDSQHAKALQHDLYARLRGEIHEGIILQLLRLRQDMEKRYLGQR